MLRRSTHVLITLVFAALTVGCNGGATAPTPTIKEDAFTGILSVLGSQSHVFTVEYSAGYSDASVTVTALSNVSNNAALSTTSGIGFGLIQFDGSCLRIPSLSADAIPLNTERTAPGFLNGQYCVQIYDFNTLTEPANYRFIVRHF